jgi:hypothetical protein
MKSMKLPDGSVLPEKALEALIRSAAITSNHKETTDQCHKMRLHNRGLGRLAKEPATDHVRDATDEEKRTTIQE